MYKSWTKKFRSLLGNPHNLILLLMGIVLTFTTFVPLIAVVNDTLSIHPGTIDAYLTHRTEGYTLANYIDLFNSRLAYTNLWRPLGNSLALAAGACITALLVGGTAAYFVVRCNIPFRKYINAVFILPFILPQWTLAVVWRNIFNSNTVTSTADGLFTSLFGINMPLWWCRGLFPCIVVMGLTYAPFAFMLMSSVLRNIDASLIETALVLKIPTKKVIRHVILPLAAPAILSTAILVSSSAMGSYPVPHYLDLVTLTTRYISLNSRYTGEASILVLIMMLAGLTSMFILHQSITSPKTFAVVTGKAMSPARLQLSPVKRWVISLILIGYTFLIGIFPILVQALETFLPNQGDYSFLATLRTNPMASLSNLTTKWWLTSENISESGMSSQLGIFYNHIIWRALLGSLWVALCCAFLAGTFGSLLGYAVAKRKRSRAAKWLDNIAYLPYIIPSLAMGAAFFILASNRFVNLYNTYTLLIIVGTVRYIPFVSRTVQDSMMQTSFEIEDAAVIMKIPWLKRMTRIILPLQKRSLLSGYFLPFTECLRDLSLFMLLCMQGFVLSTMIDYFDEVGHYAFSSGINLILIALILFSRFAFSRLTEEREKKNNLHRPTHLS